jgi:hypothetical protein
MGVRSHNRGEENGGGISDLFLAIDTQQWWEFLEHPDCADAVVLVVTINWMGIAQLPVAFGYLRLY